MNDTILALGYSGAMSYAIYRNTDDMETAVAVFVGLTIMMYLIKQKLNELENKIDDII